MNGRCLCCKDNYTDNDNGLCIACSAYVRGYIDLIETQKNYISMLAEWKDKLKQDKARLIEAIRKHIELIDTDNFCSHAIEDALELKYESEKLLKEMEE